MGILIALCCIVCGAFFGFLMASICAATRVKEAQIAAEEAYAAIKRYAEGRAK